MKYHEVAKNDDCQETHSKSKEQIIQPMYRKPEKIHAVTYVNLKNACICF